MYSFAQAFKRWSLVVVIVTFNSISSYSQLSHNIRGVAFSFYDQKIGKIDLEKDYLYRSMAVSVIQKKKLLSLPFVALTADLQTQLGITNIAESRNSNFLFKGIETAILLGINLEVSLFPDFWWLYIGGSVGPQFVSNTPSRQKKGFMFSDSVYAGSRFAISAQSQLDFKAGFRHQSNAGISQPNGGINSVYVAIGLFSAIKR